MFEFLGKRYAAPSFAAVGSLLISVLFWPTRGAINNDGVLYLNSVSAFLDQGLAAAIEIYSWPFYAVLIALVSKLGISLTNAAYVVNALTFCVLAFAFVAALRHLFPDRPRAVWLGVPVILLLPELNELRSEIVRDTGYLAFLMVSFWALLAFMRDSGWHRLLAWAVAVAVATLFRIEAFALALIGPCALLLYGPRRRAGWWILAGCAVAAVVGVALLYQLAPSSRITDFRQWTILLLELGSTLDAAADRLAEAVLGPYARSYAKDALVAVLIVVFVGNVFKGLTFVHVGLLFWARHVNGLRPAAAGRGALWAYAIGTALPPLFFVAHYQFLTQRYVFGFILVLLLLAPAAIDHLLTIIRNPRARIAVALVLLIAFSAASVRKLIHDDTVAVAGRWLATQQQGTLWSNNIVLGYYYAEHGGEGELIIDQQSNPQTLDAGVTWVVFVGRAMDAEIERLLRERGATQVRYLEGRPRSVMIWRQAQP